MLSRTKSLTCHLLAMDINGLVAQIVEMDMKFQYLLNTLIVIYVMLLLQYDLAGVITTGVVSILLHAFRLARISLSNFCKKEKIALIYIYMYS